MIKGLLALFVIVAVITVLVFELLCRYMPQLSGNKRTLGAALTIPALFVLLWLYETYCILWTGTYDNSPVSGRSIWLALTLDTALMGVVALLAGSFAAFFWSGWRVKRFK